MKHDLRVDLPRAPLAVALANAPPESWLAAQRDGELEAAREAGRREGAAAVLEGSSQLLERAVEALARSQEEARAECARQTVDLAVAIARRILRVELVAGHHDIERTVRETLAHSGVGRGSCVVHLHPADHERLRHVVFRAGTRLEPDEGVALGCVQVTTPKGLLVHEIDACIEAVAERLKGDLG